MVAPELVRERLATEADAPMASAGISAEGMGWDSLERQLGALETPTAEHAGDGREPEEQPEEWPEDPAAFIYDGVRAGRALRAGLSKRAAASRPLPMEEVYFHVKDLDNSDVRHAPDPADKANWLRLVAMGAGGLVLILLSFAPRPLLRHSGYRLEKLTQQEQALSEVNGQLKVRREMLSDLRRVEHFAGQRGLAATPPERFAWQDRTLTPVGKRSELALNLSETQPFGR
jgi:hypothetical protein